MKSYAQKLLKWYQKNYRPLPWRETNDAYEIWLSEVMLQQTRVQAVLPIYQGFLEKFPQIEDLAQAQEGELLKAWSGLGYYSRARNLQKAAIWIHENQFPDNYKDLLELPGFGLYTARAVASFAFGEIVGVLDGNVIRFLTRFFQLELQWWNSQEREHLQELSDRFVESLKEPLINQAMMELGANICLPKNPKCMLCPLQKDCKAFYTKNPDRLPLKKPKREKEIWIWKAYLVESPKKYALIYNSYSPFLKKHWIWPGEVKRRAQKPKNFDFRHSVTHHDIYVRIQSLKKKDLEKMPIPWTRNNGKDSLKELKWIAKEELPEWSPSSLIRKVIEHANRKDSSF